MNTLIIDTATAVELIAVSRDDIVSDKTALVGVSHSVTLFHNLETALRELQITINEIDLIGVGIGPGSFTGIRIAVTSARMLAQLLGVPLVDIHSQVLYAVSVPSQPGDYILIAFEARKGRVFGALYRSSHHPLAPETILSPGDYPLEKLLEEVPRNATLYLAGDGITGHYGDRPRQPSHILLNTLIPSGKDCCSLVSRIYTENPEKYARFDKVTPFYARKSDAEVVRDLKKNQSEVKKKE